MGVIMVEMLTGSRPDICGQADLTSQRSVAVNGTALTPGGDFNVAAFCASALAPDPAVRPQTARQFLHVVPLVLHTGLMGVERGG